MLRSALKSAKKAWLFPALCGALVFSAVFSPPAAAQHNNRHDEPISDEYYKLLIEKRDSIEREISSGADKNEWSGDYTAGDHHPTILMWSAAQGFVVSGSNHTFYPSRINFGKAEFTNGRLFFKPEMSKDHLNFQFIPTELVPVKWGEQHFLVASGELLNFAYAVHSGSEWQLADYFVKGSDYQKSRAGLPNLPAEFAKILKMKAIRPKIIAIKESGENVWTAEITLNLGRADNVIEAMYFYYVTDSESLRLRVSEVSNKTSKAKVAGIGTNGGDFGDLASKIGVRLTSKAPRNSYDF